MSNSSNVNDQLKDALERLEYAAESPVVPGESVAWLQSLLNALRQVSCSYHVQVRSAHEDQFEAIGIEDPALFARVEKMREEDKAIVREVDRCAANLRNLLEFREGEPDNEEAALQRAPDLAHDVLVLVIRIRKQEVALTTWLQEALQRDRGRAD